jgi:hypothetical protein
MSTPKYKSNIPAILKAIYEKRQVAQKNAPTKALNKQIRAKRNEILDAIKGLESKLLDAKKRENYDAVRRIIAQITQHEASMPALHKMPFAVSEQSRLILEAESAELKKRKKIKPQEWKARIDKIKNIDSRRAIACIVWWDFFGDRLHSERWDHLDEYIKAKPHDLSNSEAENMLVQVGYTEYMAYARVRGKSCIETEEAQ